MKFFSWSRKKPLLGARRHVLRLEPLESRCLLSAAAAAGNSLTLADLPVAAQSAISAAIGRDQVDYQAAAGAEGFQFTNPANGFTAQVQAGALQVSAGPDTCNMSLTGLGYDGAVQAVGTAKTSTNGNRVDCNYASIDEWYVNGPAGLEQGFTVPALLHGEASGSLTVELALGGDLRATVNAAGSGLTLSRPGGSTALGYTGLTACDAAGKSLPASLEVQTEGGRQELLIHVNDAGAQGPITIDPSFVEEAILTASDGAMGDDFGLSVAISGNTLVVGAPYATIGTNTYQGAAYVFTESASGAWVSTSTAAKLTASDGTASSYFGSSVSISGNTLVVGAPGTGNSPGAAYVFTEPASGGWVSTSTAAELTVSGHTLCGGSVAINGNPVTGSVVAVSYKDGATVFSQVGSAWHPGLTVTSIGSGSPSSVDVNESGTIMVVGFPQRTIGTNTAQGDAVVGTQSGSTAIISVLTAPDGSAGDMFGWSVGMNESGTSIVVGAPQSTFGARTYQGEAYVFTVPASGAWADTSTAAKLTAADGAAGDTFGSSVAINESGNMVVVGAPEAQVGSNAGEGKAYLFTEPASGAWADTSTAAVPAAADGAANDNFGGDVSISDSTAVIGAASANLNQGKVYVYEAPAAPAVTSVSPVMGLAAGGTNVTITGTGFTGATTVNFGTAAATNVAINAAGTQITATSPAGVGTVDVTVTGGPLGPSATSLADKFTYVSKDSLGIYSGGYWYIDVNGTTQIASVPSSWASATPVVGDWNGTGKTEIGLFNNATATWWLNSAGDGVFKTSETFAFGFGGSGVVPVVGDWNGAGKTEVGVYANGAWFRDIDGTHTWDATNAGAVAYLGWAPIGSQVIIPVPGQWAGDGKTEMGVYCQGVWFLDSNDSNKWDGGHTYWGWNAALIPVVGSWSGASTKSQFGVYNQGVWFLDYDNSHTWDTANQNALTYFGWAGAQPAVGNWGSGFRAAAGQAASSVQPSRLTASKLQPTASAAITGGTDLSGGNSGLKNGNQLQADIGVTDPGQYVASTSATEPIVSTSTKTLLPPLDPQAVDRVDLSTLVAGQVAGLPDLNASLDLLAGDRLGAGVRRLP